jgi:hypothetical protein
MAGLAVGAFLVAAAAALFGLFAGGRTRPAASPLLSVAALAAPGRRGRVACGGVVEPGPAGALAAPLSGTSCVWYSAHVVEHWRELDRAFVRDLDGDGKLDRSEAEAAQRERSKTEQTSSDQPFALRDGTGVVLVDPTGLEPDGLHVSVRDHVGSERQGYFPDDTIPIERAGFGVGMAAGRSSSRYDRTETVLLAGQQVSVSGELVRAADGTLLIGGRHVLVTTRQLTGAPGGVAGYGSLIWLVATLAAVIGLIALVLPVHH